MATALVDLYGGQPIPFDRIISAEGYRPSATSDEFMCDSHQGLLPASSKTGRKR